MPNNLVIPTAKSAAAKEFLAKLEPIIKALPQGASPQQFVISAVSEANNPALADCTVNSVVMALYHCSLLGLSPGPLGLAYLVPFKNKRGQKQTTLIVGYRGFCELAYGTGYLSCIESDVVLANEDWQHYRDEGGSHVHHKIGLDRRLIRENVKAAYCCWTTKDGTKGVEVVGITELLRICKDNDIWRNNFIGMSRKSAVRRAAKLWRLNLELARAILLDEQAEELDEEQDLGLRLPGSVATEKEVRLDQYGEDDQPVNQPTSQAAPQEQAAATE